MEKLEFYAFWASTNLACRDGDAYERRMDGPVSLIDAATAGAIEAIGREAGIRAMRYFRDGEQTHARVDWKTGGSPVTEADLEIDAYLHDALRALLPDAGWLSEETIDSAERLHNRVVFVVDPIDGTRAFSQGDPRFAISIAIVVDGRPVLAVLDAPALDEHFVARVGQGAFRNGRRLPDMAPATPGRLAGPKFFVDPIAPPLGMIAQPKIPSLALRLARVAAGDLEGAIAWRDAHDWDIAAADLLLTEAGAELRALDGGTLVYNRAETKHGILVAAPPSLQPSLRGAVRGEMEKWERGRKNKSHGADKGAKQ
jgi:myo-inositol-1(or 4)-monophosphatase